MELTILGLVCLTFAAGVVGGLVIAERFDLVEEPRETRRRDRQARSKKREERRRAANRRMDKMRKITTNFS